MHTTWKARRRQVLATFFAAAAVIAMEAAPQGPRDLFERARLAEENVRTLGRALELYQQVAADTGADRTLKSEAALRAALILERQGNPDAREALVAVSRRYAELSAGRAASARLAEMASQTAGLTPRFLRSGVNVPAAFSFDGRKAAVIVLKTPARYAPTSALAIQDVATGDQVMLVEAPEGVYVGSPVFSPDGRQVAYGWRIGTTASPDGRASSFVHVRSTEGGGDPGVLVGPAHAGQYAPVGWSTDGRSILVAARLQPDLSQPQLLSVDVEDRQVRHVLSFQTFQGIGSEPGLDILAPSGLKLSPSDGRILAYSAINQPGSQDRYIYTLNTDTLEQVAVATMAGVSTRPTWAPDGSHLFFVNEQSGRRGLWAIGMSGGRPEGDPRLVLTDFRASPLDMTVTGQLYNVSTQYAGFVESVAERSPAGSPIVQTFLGQSGKWSPGNKLAFIRRGGGDIADMIVRDMATGQERTYRRPGGFGVQSPRWLPDETGLIVFLNRGVDPDGPAFYRLDLASGNLTRLFARDTADHIRSAGALVSADGRSLYLLVRPRVPPPPAVDGFRPPLKWTRMVAVDLATGAEQPLLTFPGEGLVNGGGMALSPDGQTLAFNTPVERVRPPRTRLITVGVDGTNWREIHEYAAGAWVDILRWTPDGQSLLFIEGVGDPTWRMMRIAATGGPAVFDGLDSANFIGRVPLPTYEVANLANFDVSPDGRRVVFGSRTVPTYDVTVLDNLLSHVAR